MGGAARGNPIACGVNLALQFERVKIHFLGLFAGFCCLANGAYICFGSFWRFGDCGDLIFNGASIWMLWLFGIAALALGGWTWHRLGSRIGVPEGVRTIDVVLAATMASLLVSVSVIHSYFH